MNRDSQSKASCLSMRFVFRAIRDVWALEECKYSLCMTGFFFFLFITEDFVSQAHQ
jgi:hypothetical protein